jgi:hypothetical protein
MQNSVKLYFFRCRKFGSSRDMHIVTVRAFSDSDTVTSRPSPPPSLVKFLQSVIIEPCILGYVHVQSISTINWASSSIGGKTLNMHVITLLVRGWRRSWGDSVEIAEGPNCYNDLLHPSPVEFLHSLRIK